MSTVQPENTEDMYDFSYLPFERRLRIRELQIENSNRTLVFSYYNPVPEKHAVSSIVFSEEKQNGCLVPFSHIGYEELQKLENISFIPYGDITDLVTKNGIYLLQASLSSGASYFRPSIFSSYFHISASRCPRESARNWRRLLRHLSYSVLHRKAVRQSTYLVLGNLLWVAFCFLQIVWGYL